MATAFPRPLCAPSVMGSIDSSDPGSSWRIQFLSPPVVSLKVPAYVWPKYTKKTSTRGSTGNCSIFPSDTPYDSYDSLWYVFLTTSRPRSTCKPSAANPASLHRRASSSNIVCIVCFPQPRPPTPRHDVCPSGASGSNFVIAPPPTLGSRLQRSLFPMFWSTVKWRPERHWHTSFSRSLPPWLSCSPCLSVCAHAASTNPGRRSTVWKVKSDTLSLVIVLVFLHYISYLHIGTWPHQVQICCAWENIAFSNFIAWLCGSLTLYNAVCKVKSHRSNNWRTFTLCISCRVRPVGPSTACNE